jgi:hypothetical protein
VIRNKKYKHTNRILFAFLKFENEMLRSLNQNNKQRVRQDTKSKRFLATITVLLQHACKTDTKTSFSSSAQNCYNLKYRAT